MSRTVVLMVLLMLLFVYVGDMLGGQQGAIMAFMLAAAMNLFSYFFSDTMALKHYHATQVNAQSAPKLYQIVSRLAHDAHLPMPRIYIIPEQAPNAFATGRNPDHAAVAATEGLLNLLTDEEIEGVLAHEMTHVRNYDILTGSIAAVFAGAIAILGNTARYNMVTSSSNHNNGRRVSALGAILLPLAATIIQMTISRTREYKADEGAAKLTGHPEWLMSALQKLEQYAQNYRMQRANMQTAHMFIVNPFSGLSGSIAQLFSTHPSTKDRLARLNAMRK